MSDRRRQYSTPTRSICRTKTPFRSLASFLCVALILPLSSVVHAAIAVDAEVAYTTDDNVTRAQHDSDILKDRFLSVTAGANYLWRLNPNHRVVFRGVLRAEDYDEYNGLSNISGGLHVTYQYRRSGAFSEPVYGAFAKGAISEYKSELRDSNLYSIGVSWRKPVTDRISFTAILSGNWRDSDSTVFDTQDISLLLNTDYTIGSRWTVYLTYNYLDGDITSTSVYTTSPRLNFVNNADAINADDAFASGAVAYRLDAQTDVITLGTNFKLAERHSLDLSGRWIESKAKAGISYERLQFSLAYLVRF